MCSKLLLMILASVPLRIKCIVEKNEVISDV